MLNQVETAQSLAEQRLLKQGFPDDLLGNVRLKGAPDKPFEQWSFVVLDFGLRPLCGEWLVPLFILALTKWLSSDPRHDRNFHDACCRIAEFLAEDDIKAGVRQRKAQRQRAKHVRDKLTEDGVTLGGLIAKLVKAHRDERTKEIWPHFISALDAEGLHPEEFTCSKNGSDLQVRYGIRPNGKRRTLTLRRFGTLVGKARKKCRDSRASTTGDARPSRGSSSTGDGSGRR